MKFANNNMISEITNSISKPISNIDEITEMNSISMENVNIEIKLSKDVLNSFNIKQELNPEFWENDKLKKNIKNKLLKIAKDFFKSLELPENIKLKDILFVGSLANYNWSKFSDIDLHLVTDFNKFDEDKDFIKKYFDAEKNLWNKNHQIKLKHYPVEIYVQDVKEKLHASAIYSIPHDKWILKPKNDDITIDKITLKRKVQKLFDKLRNIKDNYQSKEYQKTIDKAEQLKDNIKNMRKAGLESGGEFSIENLTFKVLRRTDFMELLDSLKIKAYDHLASLNEKTL